MERQEEEDEDEEEEEKEEEEEEKWEKEKKKEEVVWTSPVGTESGANIINADARTSEAVAQASKQVVIAPEPLQEKQHEEATCARNSVQWLNLAATHDIRIRSIGQENDDELGWKRNSQHRMRLQGGDSAIN